MKINPSPQSETTSVKSTAKAAVGTDESSVEESGGFFAKLAALFKGDTKDVSKGEATQASSEKLQVSDEKAVHADSSDEILETLTDDVVENGTADVSAASADSEGETSTVPVEHGQIVIQSEATDDADVVMDEGKAILSRLHQANSTLVANGKELPHKHRSQVTDDESDADVASLPAGQDGHSTSLISGAKATAPQDVSAILDPLIATDNVAGTEHPVAPDINRIAKLLADTPETEGGEETTVQLLVEGKVIFVDIDHQGNVVTPEGKLSPQEAATALAAQASVSDTEKVKHAIIEQLMAKEAKQTALNQHAHQPQQSSQTMATAPATVHGQSDKTNPLLASASLPSDVFVTANSADASQAVLKEMVAGKAEQVMMNSSKAMLEQQKGKNVGLADITGAKDGHFAHQLSSLVGQQSTSVASGLKADMTSVQSPIHLTKEQAPSELSEKVQMMMSKNLKNIDIRLDPPELGRIHIRMHVNGDSASVSFTVANQHVRDVLEQSMPRLRDMLSQQGLQLGESAVQQQSSQQQHGYAASGRGQANADGAIPGDGGLGDSNMSHDVTLNVNVGRQKDGISYYA